MKHATPHHPKTRRLKKLIGEAPLYQVVGLLETLWQFAAEYADDGDLGRYSPEEIADWLEWKGDPAELLEHLVAARWLDRSDGRLVIHDWQDHCPEFVKKRHSRKKTSAVGGQRPPPADNGGQRQPAAANGAQTQPNPTKPNPTKPNHTNTKAAAGGGRRDDDDDGDGDWDEDRDGGPLWRIVDALRGHGVARAQLLIEQLLARGGAVSQAWAALEHYLAEPGAWQVGALVYRLQHLEAGEDPTKGWPKPTPAGERPEATAAAMAQKAQMRRQATADRRRAERRRKHLAALEAKHGARLDEDEGAVRDLIRAAGLDPPAPQPGVRGLLLELLDEAEQKGDDDASTS